VTDDDGAEADLAPAAEAEASLRSFPRVDALFAGEPPPPPRSATAFLRTLRRVLLVAIPLDALGIFCWTGVPGAVLTLYAYLAADAEMARVEGGEYSAEDAAAVARVRSISTFFLYFSVVSFLAQAALFATGLYNDYVGMVSNGLGRLAEVLGWGTDLP
jgi:hypothetical protein